MPELEGYFKALADRTRLRIINLLLTGELCVCDIQRVLQASQSSVSRHLTYMKHARLVRDRRDGVRIFYRLETEQDVTVKSLCDFLRAAFRKDNALRADLRQLKRARKEGTCATPPVETSLGSSSRASAYSTTRG
ncbi:MAG: metalloregulator ArsR/SmtB family transcription factor [Acidobacteriia bacterium]|nr:metalloregulator ArsR/SmtB family transcription factor [Terriglobia bacterium]